MVLELMVQQKRGLNFNFFKDSRKILVRLCRIAIIITGVKLLIAMKWFSQAHITSRKF